MFLKRGILHLLICIIINEMVILLNWRMICEIIIVLLYIPKECSFFCVFINVSCVSVQLKMKTKAIYLKI